jgi:predicted Ser/Thr protein kinase
MEKRRTMARGKLAEILETGTSGRQPQEAVTLLPNTPSTPATADGQSFPLAGWERYQPVRFLGQGGMGRVFLAYDVQLRRNVALKFVHEDAPELSRRFISEARAQARVKHERVCQVYEVGEVKGTSYIAMQYVEGQHLGQLERELTLEQKVLLVREAAEGVHAAHRAGLIHRDLKPSNILVERTEDGRLLPFVMDFGLARDFGEQPRVPGAVQGTPRYMAPEQARGEVSPLDRRADIYALGATLYFLLTGQPPSSAEELLPWALDKEVPEDLRAIVLKCLEQERSARYDSARALAEDLERFLDGDPVRARPVGPWTRLLRKARRHRGAVALGALALLGVSFALGQGMWARRELALRELISRRFTERVERMEAQARYAGLSRLHDTREDKQELRARMAELEAEIREGGERARGPGHYALGRALLALGDEEGARERLESAWEAGFREPRVAWALALVLGHLYQEQLLEGERVRSPALRESRRKELERRYRDPVLDWLHKSEGAEVPSPRYVAALLAFYEGRHDEALSHLDGMGRTRPWFFEAHQLRGDILLARATRRWNQGDRAGARADFESGRQAYALAAATAESLPAVHFALARLEYGALLMELYGQGDVMPCYERGLRALSRALAADPEHDDSKVQKARFHRRLAEYRTQRGSGEVEPPLAEAIEEARGALALAPGKDQARSELGLSLLQLARYRQERGEDPRELLRQALEAFETVSPEGRSSGYFTDLGLIFKVWADYEDQVGDNSLEHRGRSIESYLQSLELDERQMDAWLNLGTGYFKRATSSRGGGPDSDLEQARSALERARAINPHSYVPWFHEARVYELRAQRQHERGGDASEDLERSLSLYQEALAINLQQPQLYNGQGAVLLQQARQTWDRGGNPDPLLDKAQSAFEQARKLAPRQGFADHNLGEVNRWRAVYQLKRGEDPGPSGREAVKAYRQAIEKLPGQSLPRTGLGQAHLTDARWVLERGGAPQPLLDQATEALRGALERNPHDGATWMYLGEAQSLRARWLASRGRARSEDFESAVGPFHKALELEPTRQQHRLAEGQFYREWAAWQRQVGGDPGPLLKRGLELAETALVARTGWAEARLLRADLLLALADRPAEVLQQQAWRNQALEELAQALGSNRNLEPGWKRQLTWHSTPAAPR